MLSSHIYDFSFGDPSLSGVRVLMARDLPASDGSFESSFLDGATDIQRRLRHGRLADALLRVASVPGTQVIAVIRNPGLVVDADLQARIANSLTTLRSDLPWALAAAGGLGLGDRRYIALYASKAPVLPLPGGPQPILDLMPDFYLVDSAFAREALTEGPAPDDDALETVLAVEAYLSGRLAIYLPTLRCGIDGDLLARDLSRLDAGLRARFGTRLAGQSIPTLSGQVNIPESTADNSEELPTNLAETALSAITEASNPLSLSIVTRTRFDRPALLRRLLTSISRARRAGSRLEIILSSDADETLCEIEIEKLKADFVTLDIRLQVNRSDGPSRVVNLVEGIRAAQNDYVCVIDDDDYLDIFAFDAIMPAFFQGNHPVVITSSQVHQETWEIQPGETSALSSSEPTNKYPASGWRSMFSGVNALPVCSLLLPRNFAVRRLAGIKFRYDLSEDYALFLLFLTAPDLPEIYDVSDVFCHISIRGAENTVTMRDRRPWVRDISGHLGDLIGNPDAAGPGTWRLLAEAGRTALAREAQGVAELRAALNRREADLRLLSLENDRLRAEIALTGERTT